MLTLKIIFLFYYSISIILFNGYTFFHYLSFSRNIEIGKLLFLYGAKINEKDNKNKTPLDWAKVYNDFEFINFLIQNIK